MKPDAGERAAQVLLALLKSVCFLALFLGSQVLVVLPLVIAASIQAAVTGRALDEAALAMALNQRAMAYSLIANLLTLTIVLTFYFICRKKFSEALWLRRVEAPTLWVGVALAPGLYLAVSAVLLALPESWMESYNEASSGITSGGMVGIIAIAVAAPVVEEIIFRGLIMTRLSAAMPGWLAVLLSAAIFGACHGHPIWMGYAFALGALFGFMDLRAGSIWPSILGHVAFNSIDQVGSLLPDSDLASLVYLGVLVVLAVAAPVLDRKAVAAMIGPRPKAKLPARQLPVLPGVYEFDPWES